MRKSILILTLFSCMWLVGCPASTPTTTTSGIVGKWGITTTETVEEFTIDVTESFSFSEDGTYILAVEERYTGPDENEWVQTVGFQGPYSVNAAVVPNQLTITFDKVGAYEDGVWTWGDYDGEYVAYFIYELLPDGTLKLEGNKSSMPTEFDDNAAILSRLE